MGFTSLLLVLCLALGLSEATISLSPVSTIYLPSDYGGRADTKGLFQLNSGAAFKTAYDVDKQLAYVGGGKFLHIVDFSDIIHPKIAEKFATQRPVSDIAECGDLVAYLHPGAQKTEPGTLRIFEKFNPVTKVMKELCSVTVGAMPIALRFAQGCSLIIVANEGSMGENTNTRAWENPEGTITTVRLAGAVSNSPSQQRFNTTFGTETTTADPFPPFPPQGTSNPGTGGGFGGNNPQYPIAPTTPLPGTVCTGTPTMSYVVNEVNFTQFNPVANRYTSRHVRHPYKGQMGDPGPNTFSRGLEPKHITLDQQEQTAFISLQENNAIAAIDLTANAVIDIYPMGVKNWKGLPMDASSADGGAILSNYTVKSFPMPDAIESYYDANGDLYIVTANEGAAPMVLECSARACAGGADFEETEIGEEFVVEEMLTQNVPLQTREDMALEERLGQTRFSLVDGNTPNDPELFDQVFMFGGRGISAYKVDPFNNTMTLAWDSGSIIEKEVKKFYPKVFNGAAIVNNARTVGPKQTVDSKSGERGPECESLAIGDVQGRKIIFVGVDGVSALAIFSVPPGNSTPVYESIFRDGYVDGSFHALYRRRRTGDLSPESLTFIPPEKTSSRKPLLLVTGRVSGTVSMYEVIDMPYWMLLKTLGTKEGSGTGHAIASSSSSILAVLISGFIAVLCNWS